MNCNACMSTSLMVHICREKSFEDKCLISHEGIFWDVGCIVGRRKNSRRIFWQESELGRLDYISRAHNRRPTHRFGTHWMTMAQIDDHHTDFSRTGRPGHKMDERIWALHGICTDWTRAATRKLDK